MMPVLASIEDQTRVVKEPQVGSVVAIDWVKLTIRKTLVTQTKIPSAKIITTPILLPRVICSRIMTGVGSMHTQISNIVLEVAKDQRNAALLMQVPGLVFSQDLSIGVH